MEETTQPGKPDRSLQASLMITAIFMALLVLVGIAVRPEETDSGSKPTAKAPGNGEPAVDSDASGLNDLVPSPSEIQPRRERLEILSDCMLFPSTDNDADSIWVASNRGRFRFKLNYVDAPDFGNSRSEDTQRLMRHFKGTNEQAIRELAQLGSKFIEEQLTARNFDVVTRWEQALEESTNEVPTYRAYIMIINDKRELVNLSDLVVRRGLAMIDTECEEPLPNSRLREEYLKKLQGLEARSKETTSGGWAIAGNPPQSGQQTVPVRGAIPE